ncbi:hypothetical protein HAX54_033645 [Datura stramonium]|uniref:Uncharacterized protein n=1 Tax=Datura stramonium TaxID=4076 RepID=A0ABS8SDQ8_DATST|nr:hypothetical protein [Datura stramonium]
MGEEEDDGVSRVGGGLAGAIETGRDEMEILVVDGVVSPEKVKRRGKRNVEWSAGEKGKWKVNEVDFSREARGCAAVFEKWRGKYIGECGDFRPAVRRRDERERGGGGGGFRFRRRKQRRAALRKCGLRKVEKKGERGKRNVIPPE